MLAKITLFLIKIYRKTSFLRPSCCRFYPSCSQYAEEAIQKYGVSAIFIALMRIIRCNQFFKGGYDPIP